LKNQFECIPLRMLALTFSLLAFASCRHQMSEGRSDEYLVVDLVGGTNTVSYPVSYLDGVPADGWTDEYKTTKLVMRRIRAGSFVMGSPEDELRRSTREKQRQVTLTNDFYIGVFEVTQRQWELVMGNKPSYFNNVTDYATRPVEQVSYFDACENPKNRDDPAVNWPSNSLVNANSFMGRMRAMTGFDGFDLPTEAQWEYACRAGTVTALSSGKNLVASTNCPNMSLLGRYWFNGGESYTNAVDACAGTAKVGSYQPNPWGLYDMHGNVYEWCRDWYTPYPQDAVEPRGAVKGKYRLSRGGSWHSLAMRCRSAQRQVYDPRSRWNYTGFRPVITLSPPVDVVPQTGAF